MKYAMIYLWIYTQCYVIIHIIRTQYSVHKSQQIVFNCQKMSEHPQWLDKKKQTTRFFSSSLSLSPCSLSGVSLRLCIKCKMFLDVFLHFIHFIHSFGFHIDASPLHTHTHTHSRNHLNVATAMRSWKIAICCSLNIYKEAFGWLVGCCCCFFSILIARAFSSTTPQTRTWCLLINKKSWQFRINNQNNTWLIYIYILYMRR